MAKNEAKIKFTAETTDFNDSIEKSNQKMSELKAEMRLNDNQMKTTGNSTDGLKNKHKLLEAQLKVSGDKTEALSHKLEAAERNFGENSSEASKLRTQLLNAQTAEERIKQQINSCNNELDDQAKGFKDSSDAAANSQGGFTIAKGAIADLVSNGIQWCIGKVGELLNSLKSLPEETRELRQDLATLDTSFSEMGFKTEEAEQSWKDLYAVFGEDDRAVETANNISHMAKNQKELNDWVTITTGVWGSYQDALPVESLAEASNETAKTGKVTGVLADALNWSSEASKKFAGYMGGDVKTAEDAFNVALSECSTEQERQTLITETLNSLYGDAATKYKETAGAQIEAKEAAAEQMLAENELANAIEPVTTKSSELKTELMVGITPAVKGLSEVALNALNWMQAHPAAMQTIIVVAGVLGVALTTLAVATAVQTAAQWAMNSAILANPITWIVVGIVAGITALIAAGVALYRNWDKIKAKATELWTKVKTTFTNLKNNVIGIWTAIKTGIATRVESVKNKVVAVFTGIKDRATGIWNSIKEAVIGKVLSMKNGIGERVDAIKTKVSTVFTKVKTAITNPIESAKTKVKEVVDKIKGFFDGLKLKLPKIKLPHFSITGKLSLAPPQVPKLNIDWYAKGGILTKPTVFGVNGNSLMAGGEAGAEAILPIDRLQGYIDNAITKHINDSGMGELINSIDKLATRPVQINIDGKQVAVATASHTDSVSGKRNILKNRGLAFE